MSSHCRRFGTRFGNARPKLLIVKDSATVAEGRQASRALTQPGNNRKRHKVHATSERGAKITFVVAHAIAAMELKVASCRVHTG